MDGQTNQIVRPEEVNIDPQRVSRAIDVLREGIDSGAMPGAVVCGFRRGRMFIHEALGTIDGTRKNSVETIYDLASITKPMATASSVLTLLERGKLTLMQSIAAILGEARAGHLSNVTIGHLLTHTSGLPAHRQLWEKGATDLESAVDAILHTPVVPAGTKYEYSCLGFILLGRIVQEVSGKPLSVFAKEEVFEHLGLTQTGYKPQELLRDRIAPTKSLERAIDGDDPQSGHVGIVNDGNARCIGGVAGNAGLFGTAMDVAIFGVAMLLKNSPGATPATRSLFGAPTRQRILENQVKPAIGGHTLMFFAQPNPLCPSGDLLSAKTVGHSGFTGNVLTIDPEHDLVIVVLTNRVFIDSDGAKWLSCRRKFLNALASSIY